MSLRGLADEGSAGYDGQYIIGRVVENNDPEKVGRVKVLIPGLFEDAATAPWCVPLVPRGISSKPGSGEFSVPDVGTDLVIVLQEGDAHYPAYVGSLLSTPNRVSEFDTNYPKRRGFKDIAGNLFYIDTTSGQVVVKFVHKSGTEITIDDDGKVHVLAANNMNINVDGTLDITSTGNMTLNAPRIDLNP